MSSSIIFGMLHDKHTNKITVFSYNHPLSAFPVGSCVYLYSLINLWCKMISAIYSNISRFSLHNVWSYSLQTMIEELIVFAVFCATLWWFCCTGKSNSKSFNMTEHRDMIADRYNSLEEVQAAIKSEGMESCNLIIGWYDAALIGLSAVETLLLYLVI